MAAMQIQQRQQDQQWRADDRAYSRQQDAIANQRADRQYADTQARQAKMDGRADEEWRMKLDAHMRGLKADEMAAQTAEMEGVLSGAAWFYQSGDQAGYDQFLQSKGIDPAQYPFAQFPAHAAQFKPVLDAMKGFKPGGEDVEVGLNPVYGRDADGNVVVMQLGKNGQAVRTGIPEGVTPDLAVKTQEGARGTAVGKATGEAQAALPGAYTEANHVIGMVDDLLADPYLPKMLGPIASRLPNTSPDAARVQSRMDQVGGQGFMAARQFLKGQGQITDFESRRAEAAIARMSAAQDYGDYVEAMREFQDAVRVGVMKAEQAAGKQTTGEAPAAAQAQRKRYNPQTGAFE